MIKYCEVKLVNLNKLHIPLPKMNKNLSSNTISKNISNKAKLINLTDISKHNSVNTGKGKISEFRETRQSKRTNSSHSNQELKSEYKNKKEKSGNFLKEIKDNVDIDGGITRKRKCDSGTENTNESPRKKVCNKIASPLPTKSMSSNPDQKIKQRKRKRKHKSRESFWENKLTGARRVSKRLTNLRIKQKILENLRPQYDGSEIVTDQKQVNFSTKGKNKIIEELHSKSKRGIKSNVYKQSLKKERSEVQINYGKLSHTKRIYPKISTGRRPTTYKVTIKTSSSFQDDFSDSTNKQNQHDPQVINFTDEESEHSEIHSIITKFVENIQGEIDNENKQDSTQINETIQEIEISESQNNQQSSVNETVTEDDQGICEEPSEGTQENQILTVGEISLKEKNDDSQTVIVIDIDSKENECEIVEANQVSSSISESIENSCKPSSESPKSNDDPANQTTNNKESCNIEVTNKENESKQEKSEIDSIHDNSENITKSQTMPN